MNPWRQSSTKGGRPLGLAVALIIASLTLTLAWPRAAPAAGTWSETGPLATARHVHRATRLADGRVLAAGGEGPSGPLASAELYDPATGKWSPTDSLSTAVFTYTITLLNDGRVLVAGGYDGVKAVASAQVYDPHNCVQNGSFEAASVDPGGSSIMLPNGNTAITGWTVGDAGIDYRGDWQNAEGRRCLDLNASGPGSIKQVIDTDPGVRYLVTFALAGNPLGEPAVKTLRVSVGDQSQDSFFDITGKSTTNMGWTNKSWIFTAKNAQTTLEFRSLTSGAYGPALDKVRVIRVTPLPPLPLLLD